MTHVAIVDSGVANLASVSRAFDALGVAHEITRDSRVVLSATHVVLPGVGSFAAGLAELRRHGLDDAVRKVHQRGTPLLAVCVGMQMLGEGSAESPEIPGLAIFSGRFERLPSTVRVPHLGWNDVEADGRSLLVSGFAAFAHSYYLSKPPPAWGTAWTSHGTRFVSALVRGRTLACQFHPELSGSFGMRLLRRWLTAEAVTPTAKRAGDPRPALAHRVIPCLDVSGGRVVKGVRFQKLRDAGDPALRAARYECQGADEIVLLDIAATPQARNTRVEIVRQVRRRLHIPLTVGGGVRSLKDARRLLEAGADKVSVNTAAVRDPSLLERLADCFGSQCVVLAIDARRKAEGWEAQVMGGRSSSGLDAIQWGTAGARRGAGEILLTSWDRDGTRAGCDLDLIGQLRNAVQVPIIASGGIGSCTDALDACRAGADAVLAASVFHDGDLSISDIKNRLAEEGIAVRP